MDGIFDLQAVIVDNKEIGFVILLEVPAKSRIDLGATRLFWRHLNEGTSAVEHTTGYTLYDLAVNYDTGRFGKLSLGVENVSDQFYILSYSQVGGQDNYMSGAAG